MRENRRIGIDQRDLCSQRRRGVLYEVTGARADVEVSSTHMRAVTLDEFRHRALPHRARHEAEDERVVDGEHEAVVARLSLVCGIAPIHPALLGSVDA